MKLFCQTFSKTAPTPLEKPLHLRSRNRSCFWKSRSPAKQALNRYISIKSNGVYTFVFPINIVIFSRFQWTLASFNIMAELIYNWSCVSILLEFMVTFWAWRLVQRINIAIVLHWYNIIFSLLYLSSFHIALSPPIQASRWWHSLRSHYFFSFCPGGHTCPLESQR